MKSAWRMLARDWRAGELGVLAAALVIAVASVTSVGFFADRVGQALERDAHQLLGADLVLAADHPWSARIVERLRGAGVQSAEALNFVSMALRSGQSQLAGVKAVSENYPLRGRLRIAFTLPRAAPARADVFDLSGRRVLTRDLEARAGPQLVDLAEGRSLAAGLYLVKLSQGGRSVLTKAVVVH